MATPTQLFQHRVKSALQCLFPTETIEEEWAAIKNISGVYSPRIDVAVGPFSTIRGGNLISEYNQLMSSSRELIERLIACHNSNIFRYLDTDDSRVTDAVGRPSFHGIRDFNRNARCLMAIEIENRVSRKHLLGGALNSSTLGRIGVAVGWDEGKVRALVRLLGYWSLLGSVGKNTFSTDNLLILSPSQLLDALQ